MSGKDVLSKEFLEALLEKITGRKIPITSPEMGPTPEGMGRVFRGEMQGETNKRGQIFTRSLPNAIKHMESLGGPEKGAVVNATDIPDEVLGKSSSIGRQDTGRMGIREGLQENPDVTRELIPYTHEDTLHYVIPKFANAKKQIIPAVLMMALQKAGMDTSGFMTPEDADRLQKAGLQPNGYSTPEAGASFEKAHPWKAEIGKQVEDLAVNAPIYAAMGGVVPKAFMRLLEAAGIGVGAGTVIKDTVGYGLPHGENELPPEIQLDMQKLGIGSTLNNPMKPVEPEFGVHFPDISPADAFAILGGVAGAASMSGRVHAEHNAQKAATAALSKERIPMTPPTDYKGLSGAPITLADIKDITQEPYPSGGALQYKPQTIAQPGFPQPEQRVQGPAMLSTKGRVRGQEVPMNRYLGPNDSVVVKKAFPGGPGTQSQPLNTMDALDADKEAFTKKQAGMESPMPPEEGAKEGSTLDNLRVLYDLFKILRKSKLGF